MKKVLGIGNALVDIIADVNENFWDYKKYPKGSMNLVDQKFSEELRNKLQNKKMVSGGSAGNTICALSELSIPTSFIGKIGNDEMGKFFQKDMKKRNIDIKLITDIELGTGICCSLITPDKERTMFTYLGAASNLKSHELKKEFFKNNDYFYIEGYLLQDWELIKTAVSIAKNNNLTVCLDFASYNIVEENIIFLEELIDSYIDILFANEDEMKMFLSKSKYNIEYLKNKLNIIIEKKGKNGVKVISTNFDETVETYPANVIDTTGAGDAFAAGFLYGLIKDQNLTNCAKLGNLLGSTAVEYYGAKIPEEKWEKVKEKIDKILE